MAYRHAAWRVVNGVAPSWEHLHPGRSALPHSRTAAARSPARHRCGRPTQRAVAAQRSAVWLRRVFVSKQLASWDGLDKPAGPIHETQVRVWREERKTSSLTALRWKLGLAYPTTTLSIPPSSCAFSSPTHQREACHTPCRQSRRAR